MAFMHVQHQSIDHSGLVAFVKQNCVNFFLLTHFYNQTRLIHV